MTDKSCLIQQSLPQEPHALGLCCCLECDCLCQGALGPNWSTSNMVLLTSVSSKSAAVGTQAQLHADRSSKRHCLGAEQTCPARSDAGDTFNSANPAMPEATLT